MKIMSFNTQSCTNYITQEIDYKIMGDAIKKCDADIVGLNEIHEESHMENYSFQTRKVADVAGFVLEAIGTSGGTGACFLETRASLSSKSTKIFLRSVLPGAAADIPVSVKTIMLLHRIPISGLWLR